MKIQAFFIGVLLMFTSHAHAKVKTETVEYKDGETILEGYLSYDTSVKGKRPGVVVVHDWMGNGEYSKMRAEKMAAMGYVALAADIYGKGVRPKDSAEAGKLAGEYRGGDRTNLRRRDHCHR